MSKTKFALGYALVQIALAIIFIVSGLALLGTGSFFTHNEIQSAVNQLFSGDLRKLVTIAVGVVLLACGIMQLVGLVMKNTPAVTVLKMVTLIVWIVVAIMADVLGGIRMDTSWFTKVAYDLLIIGGLLIDTAV